MKENTTPQNTTSDSTEQETKPQEESTAKQGSRLFSMGNFGSMLSEKEQKSLLFYIAVGIILVECAVTVGALITGIAGAEQLGHGKVQFNFPWTGYLVTVVVAPIIVILLVNLIGMGFYRAVHGEPVMSAEQFDKMPEKARNIFSLISGAPSIILFGGIIILGAVLYYLDGVMSLLLKLGDSVETIIIWGTCGLVIAWVLSYAARMYFMYKTRRIEEDYAYRREVLERTGMVILDGKAMLGANDGGQYLVERALPSGGQNMDAVVNVEALPAPEVEEIVAEVEEIVAEVKEVVPEAQEIVQDAEIIEPEIKAEVKAEVKAEPELKVEPIEVIEVVEIVEEVKIVEAPEIVEEVKSIEVVEAIPEVKEIVPDAEEIAAVKIVHIAVNALDDSCAMAVPKEPALKEPVSAIVAEELSEPVQIEPVVEIVEVAEVVEVVEAVEPEQKAKLVQNETAKPTAPQAPSLTQKVVQTAQKEETPKAPKTPIRRARLTAKQKHRR